MYDKRAEVYMSYSNLYGICLSKSGVFLASMAALLVVIGTVGPVYASVPPGTSVTASSQRLTLDVEVQGAPDTITCDGVTDTFVVTSGERDHAIVPPPAVTGCTDSFNPDPVDASITISTNENHGNWMLEVNGLGSGECSKQCVLGLLIPKAGATVASAALSGCKGVLAPKGSQLLTGKYKPSTGTVTFKNTLVPMGSKGCTIESPVTLNVTIIFSPNLGRIPPFSR
jgi:hypothetical protein